MLAIDIFLLFQKIGVWKFKKFYIFGKCPFTEMALLNVFQQNSHLGRMSIQEIVCWRNGTLVKHL
uniref:Uncharacterized protein n=1 Tax=Rhizophagus irregularis (strain DAOM 181602 / DAOM 197198 / MUCL 43194) TaxID=747089 RepID=U9U4Z4_RHIID